MHDTEDDGTAATEVRIRAHPGLCAGWGNCHRFAPTVYPLDEQGQLAVHVMAVGPELAADARLGASACPERAIIVIDAVTVEVSGRG